MQIREADDETDYRRLDVNIEGFETGDDDAEGYALQRSRKEEETANSSAGKIDAATEAPEQKPAPAPAEEVEEAEALPEPAPVLAAVEAGTIDEVSLEQLKEMEDEEGEEEAAEEETPARSSRKLRKKG